MLPLIHSRAYLDKNDINTTAIMCWKTPRGKSWAYYLKINKPSLKSLSYLFASTNVVTFLPSRCLIMFLLAYTEWCDLKVNFSLLQYVKVSDAYFKLKERQMTSILQTAYDWSKSKVEISFSCDDLIRLKWNTLAQPNTCKCSTAETIKMLIPNISNPHFWGTGLSDGSQ